MRNPFERLTNAITMHKLTQNVLLVLVLATCIAGAFGAISYSPPEIIVSTLVLVVACLGSNTLLSRAYGVRNDVQSALITALILALVLAPGLDPLRLATVGLVGVIAQASKYVITWRGRHIFNPAAAGLVIASLSGLSYSAWWVAAPPLALVTAIGTVVVLSKVRLLGMGGLFIAIAAGIIIVRSVVGGSEPIDAYLAAFMSWPILFVAGFMLTEPTTLPPRRWQKYLVAGIVAVLFALPFSIGPFSTSPAVALIVGNAVAFAFGQRHAIILKLREVRSLTPSIKEFVFTPAVPLAFAPGQYLDVFLPHAKADFRSTRRSFSIASAPGGDVSLGIRFAEPGSTFKQALLTLEPGDTLTATTISGDFTLPGDPSEKLLFIAGGIGITPFVSHIRAMYDGTERDIQLLYFVRSKQDATYVDVTSSVPSKIFTDNEKLTPEMIRSVPDYKNRTAYISGPPAMVAAAKKAAKAAGIRKIRTDYFSGY